MYPTSSCAGWIRRSGDAALYLRHHRPAQRGELPAPAAALDGADHGFPAALESPQPYRHLPLLSAHESRGRGSPGDLLSLLCAGGGEHLLFRGPEGAPAGSAPAAANDLLLRAAHLREDLGGGGG